MTTILKTPHILAILIAASFSLLTVSGVNAAGSISGSDVCGGTLAKACTLKDLQKITSNIMTAVIGIGLPVLMIFVAYRLVTAWYALQQGNANAYREAFSKIMNALLGFVVVVALFGGFFLAILKFVGVEAFPLKLLEVIFGALVPHAYAQGLANPLVVNDLYDFILSVLRLVMRFFIYPAFIVMWVWTGIQFVMAEGNPEALGKAKKWLLWAFVSTVLVMMLQGFLFAIRGSVQKIFSETSTHVIERSV